jgi:ribosome-binding protein aMBF1 (putative translation factor)
MRNNKINKPSQNLSELYTIITNNIRKGVKNKGISLKKLASDIQMSEAGFFQMLDRGTMKVTILKKIADALETPVECFFNESFTESENNCKICGSETDTVFNIDFKPIVICKDCAEAIYMQQALWYSQNSTSKDNIPGIGF